MSIANNLKEFEKCGPVPMGIRLSRFDDMAMTLLIPSRLPKLFTIKLVT